MESEIINIEKIYTILIDKLTTWSESFIGILPNLVVCIGIIIVFWLLARLTRNLTSRVFGKVSNNEALNNLIKTIAYIAVISVGFFIALSILKLDKAVTSLLAGAGVIGLALGFAFQDTATNFISGIFMAIRKPFKIGDIITTGDQMGTIIRMNLRNVIMKSFTGQEVIIPNKDVFQNNVTNYIVTGIRRVDLEIGVSYSSDLESVREIAINTIKDLDFVLKGKNVEFYYNEFGGSSINFSLRYWIEYPDEPGFLTARSEGIIAIKKAFDNNDINIPFPIRTLDIDSKQLEPIVKMMQTKQS